MPILQIWKQMLRKIKQFAQGQKPNKWQKRDSNAGSQILPPEFLL